MRLLLIVLSFIFLTPIAAAQTVPPVESYARIPKVYDAAITPDGNLIAVVVEYYGEYYVRVIDLTNTDPGEPKLAAIGSKMEVEWIKWANNDRLLVSVTQQDFSDGVPHYQGWLLTGDKNLEDFDVLVDPGYRVQYKNRVVDFLVDDPDHILMNYAEDGGHGADVMRVNVETGRDRRVRNGLVSIQQWYTDRRGEVRLGEGRTERGKYVFRIRDINSDKWENEDKHPNLPATAAFFGFGDDPSHLYYGCSKVGTDTRAVCLYNTETRESEGLVYSNPDYDVTSLKLSPDGKKVVGYNYIAGQMETHFIDADYEQAFGTIRAQVPGFAVRFVDQTPDGKRVLFQASNPSAPGALMLYDQEAGGSMVMLENYPELDGVVQGLVVPVKYSARDGEKIPAFVTLPPVIESTDQIKDLPFVIFPHGGPYARDSERFDYWAQFFASRGYGVLQMNFRGSAGYGSAFKQAGRENWQLMLDDIHDGTQWLIEKGYADEDRICVAGASFGGYAALMSAIQNPDEYICTISFAGVTDINDLINDMRKYVGGRVAAKESILTGFDGNSERKEASPAKRADEIKIPVLLMHGEHDVNVHFDQYKRMKSALKRADADATFLEMDEADHYIRRYKHRLEVFEAMDAFLGKHLGEGKLTVD